MHENDMGMTSRAVSRGENVRPHDLAEWKSETELAEAMSDTDAMPI